MMGVEGNLITVFDALIGGVDVLIGVVDVLIGVVDDLKGVVEDVDGDLVNLCVVEFDFLVVDNGVCGAISGHKMIVLSLSNGRRRC
jgi:hypothetical protein